MLADFQARRPRHGYCYLDFVEVWLWHAIQARDAELTYKYARELGHWALIFEDGYHV